MRLLEFLPPPTDPTQNPDWLFGAIAALAAAPAPSGSALLPGAVGDPLQALVRELGLERRFERNLGHTWNAALTFGAPGDADLILTAHIDKPGFGVARMDGPGLARLFPCSAVRFPCAPFETGARSERYDRELGRLIVASRGRILYDRGTKGDEIFYEVREGELGADDTVSYLHPAERQGDIVRSNSLDDVAGVVALLGAACAIARWEDALVRAGRRVLLAFTDFEEWPPEALFGQGALRLGHALRAPSIGSACVDVHPVGPGIIGHGLSLGFVSSQGRGVPVPHDMRALQVALVERLNALHPHTAQICRGYFSRSDDFGLMRWSRVVGLFGLVIEGVHQGPETGSLHDVAAAARTLAAFCAAACGLVEDL